jgi:hypothetical protein
LAFAAFAVPAAAAETPQWNGRLVEDGIYVYSADLQDAAELDGYRARDESIEIRGEVLADEPVAALSYVVRTELSSYETELEPSDEFEVAGLQLDYGRNRLVFTALDTGGTKYETTINIMNFITSDPENEMIDDVFELPLGVGGYDSPVFEDNAAPPYITLRLKGDPIYNAVVYETRNEWDLPTPAIVGKAIRVGLSNNVLGGTVAFDPERTYGLNELVICRYDHDTRDLEPLETTLDWEGRFCAELKGPADYMLVDIAVMMDYLGVDLTARLEEPPIAEPAAQGEPGTYGAVFTGGEEGANAENNPLAEVRYDILFGGLSIALCGVFLLIFLVYRRKTREDDMDDSF